MPGISKTLSMMTLPANMTESIPPKPVAMGISAFLSAWHHTARRVFLYVDSVVISQE